MNENETFVETTIQGPTRLTTKRNGRVPAAGRKEGVTPAFVLHALRRWWKIAAPLGILLAAASVGVIFLQFKPMYAAVGYVRIREHQPYLAFPTQTGGQQSKRFVETQLQVFRLPTVLRTVCYDRDILDHPEICEAPDAVDYLRRNIQVKAVGESEIYTVEYQAVDKMRAKQVVDAVIKSYMNYVNNYNESFRKELADSLNTAIASQKIEIEDKRKKLKDSSESTGLTPLPITGVSANVLGNDPISQMRALLVQAEVDIVMLTAAVEFAAKHASEPVQPSERDIEETISAQLSEHQRQLQERREQVKRLQATVTQPSSPRIQQEIASLAAAEQKCEKLEAELRAQACATLENSEERSREAGLEELRWQLATAQTKKATLSERLEEEETKSNTSVGAQLDVDFANRELLQAESIHDLLVQQRTRLETEKDAPNRVFSEDGKEGVIPSDQPIKVMPLKEMLLAAAFSLCIPFGLAVGWEWTVKRVNNVDEIRQQMGVEILGEITALPSFAYGQRASKRTITSRQLFEESVDGLRTTLVLADSMHDNRVLAIASAVSSEGKTSVATHLAMSLARTTGKPILLMDGDMRAPDIHRMFDLPLNPGLADVLTGEANLDEALLDSGFPQLDILPAGLLTTNPHRLLHNGEFRSLLDSLRHKYTYIIIDTPPVLGASESLVLAKHADATVVCAMRDRTRMSHIQQAHTRLASAGASTIGVVMSGLPVRHYASRYGSYSYGKSPIE